METIISAKLKRTVLAATFVVGVAGGCAHQEKKAQNPATAAATLRPPVVVAKTTSAAAPVTAQTAAPAAQKKDAAIYFDFENALLNESAVSTLKDVGDQLKSKPTTNIEIDGNCDERGTTEYNLALGEQRAHSAQEYLARLGVSTKRIHIVSYGKERPKYDGHDESAWSKNRRDDIVLN